MSFLIRIKKSVVDAIIYYSKEAYPNEFFAYLEGKRTSKTILIKNLAYYPNDARENKVVTIFHLGTYTTDFIGTIHSHPTGNNKPSKADKDSFNKTGIVHVIINYPYKNDNIKYYDYKGEEISVKVV